MSFDEEQKIREKLEQGIVPTLYEVERLFQMYDLLVYENDFLRTDRTILMEDNDALREHCIKSNPALNFEIDSKRVKSTNN